MKKKVIMKTALFIGTVAMVTTLFAQGVSTGWGGSSSYVSIVVIHQVVRPNARYTLMEGIEVAIKNVKLKGIALTPQNVLVELNQMAGSNDIRLPYHYTEQSSFSATTKGGRFRGKTTSRKVLTADQMKKKQEFEMIVARCVAKKTGKDVSQYDLSQFSEPTPEQYKDKKIFINAYVRYKMRFADESIREKYSKKIGGMADYKRDMEKEAGRLWSGK